MNEQEGLFDLEPEVQPRKPRPPDPVWNALTQHFGEPRTKEERARRNNAVKSLKEAEATPEEIAIVIDFCQRNFSQFTEMAICLWISRALKEHEETKSVDNVIELAFRRMQDGRRQDS